MQQNALLVLGGRGGFLGLWFLSILVLIRILGPGDFGIYSLCVAVVKIVTSVWGEALDFAVLRQVPLLISTDRPQAFVLMRTVLWSRLMLGITVVVLAGAFAPSLSETFFRVTTYASLIRLVSLSILGDLLLRALLTYFQATEAFFRLILLDGVLQVGRFAAVLVLLATQSLTLTSALAVYAGFPYLAFVVGVFLVPQEWTWFPFPRRSDVAEVFRYSRWLLLSFLVASLYERTDILLLGHFRTTAEVGVYSAALTLATLPDFVVACLTTVLSPRIVHLYAAGQLAAFNRRYWRWALPIAGLAAVGALSVGGFLIRTFLTERYETAIPAFQVLVVGTLFWGAVTPVSTSLLALVAPQRIVLVTVSALVCMSLFGSVLIPAFGFMGAAGLVVGMKVAVGVWIVVLAHRLLSQTPAAAPQGVPLHNHASLRQEDPPLAPHPLIEGPRL
jgi:O-antigen/teichoic acid export membrane protein